MRSHSRRQPNLLRQAQMKVQQVPKNYAGYLELFHSLGAEIYADTDMNVVTGESARILAPHETFPFVQPLTWAGVAEQIAQSDVVINY